MQKIRNKGYNNMRKVIIFLLVFTIGLVSFSLESKETLLKLIEEVEKEPIAEKSIEKYERIIRFSIESNDVQVMLFPEIISYKKFRIITIQVPITQKRCIDIPIFGCTLESPNIIYGFLF